MIAVKVVVGAAILVLFSPATLTSDGPGASFIGAIVSLKRVCINSFVVLGWFREDVLAAAAFLFLLLYTYAASPVWRTYIQRSVFYIYIYIYASSGNGARRRPCRILVQVICTMR